MEAQLIHLGNSPIYLVGYIAWGSYFLLKNLDLEIYLTFSFSFSSIFYFALTNVSCALKMFSSDPIIFLIKQIGLVHGSQYHI